MSFLSAVYVADFGTATLECWELGDLLLRIGLSTVTLVSGVGKLVDPESGRQAMADFGVPGRWVERSARALPVMEIVLGLALLNDGTCPPAALALAVMFCFFGVGIGNLLRQDKAPPCNCFGTVHSEPVSIYTLIRVLVLAVLSLVCWSLPTFPLVTSWKGFFLLVPIYLGAGFGVRKWAQHKQKNRTIARLKVGQRVPAVTLKSGEWLQSVLPKGKRSLLLLTAPDCCPCRHIKGLLIEWAPALSQDLPFVELVGLQEGQELESTEGLITYGLSAEEVKRFLSPTPGAFLVDQSGTILQPPVSGVEEIQALIRVALR